jgi:hypothetical protein
LLGERDKVIQDMKEEKDDREKTVESLRSALRSQEQSAGRLWTLVYRELIRIFHADKFREENWNLEVMLQELRAQLSDSQASSRRFESEQKRLTKLLSAAREGADQIEIENEKLLEEQRRGAQEADGLRKRIAEMQSKFEEERSRSGESLEYSSCSTQLGSPGSPSAGLPLDRSSPDSSDRLSNVLYQSDQPRPDDDDPEGWIRL